MRLVSDVAWAVMTILQEAAGEPYEGKVAVAEVIRNRMNARYASDGTVAGTVLRAMQFSGWNASDPGRVRNAKADDQDLITQDCIRAWRDAMGGSNLAHGAVLYYNADVCRRLGYQEPAWAKPEYSVQVAHIGGHRFFIERKRGASSAQV